MTTMIQLFFNILTTVIAYYGIWFFARILSGFAIISKHSQKVSIDANVTEIEQVIEIEQSVNPVEEITVELAESSVASSFVPDDTVAVNDTIQPFQKVIGYWTDCNGNIHTIARWSFYDDAEKCAFCGLAGDISYQKYYDESPPENQKLVHSCSGCGAPCFGCEREM